MHSTSVLVCAVLVCLIGGGTCLSGSSGWGRCPQPPVQQPFDFNLYTGAWYEYQRFSVAYEAFVKCGKAQYQVQRYDQNTGGPILSVTNSGIKELKIGDHTIFRKNSSTVGQATIPDLSQPAKLVVTFGGQILSYFARGDYWVLSTDYNSYALVYSCTALPFNVGYFDVAWILTRERGVSPGNLADLYQILSDAGVNPGSFFTVDQQDCDLPDMDMRG